MEKLTYDQKAVGIKFNPGELKDVDVIKQKCAEHHSTHKYFKAICLLRNKEERYCSK